MANDMYSDSNEKQKGKIPKKVIIIGVAVLLLIVLIIVANVSKSEPEPEPVAEEVVEEEPVLSDEDAEAAEAAEEQAALVKVYGEAPAGFRWDADSVEEGGTLIPLSDSSLTPEEVVYQYIRSVSLLDISNAQKYAWHSQIVTSMKNFYEVDNGETDYYSQFFRNVYSTALTSIEIDGVARETLFAEGKRVYTLNLKVLDLSNKDFWQSNADQIFKTLNKYTIEESDSTKAQQYVFDELLKYYQSDKALKKDVQVDIVLTKLSNAGWLVNDDTDLDMILQYKEGTSVYSYVMDKYSEWLDGQYEKLEK